jgi:mono/diheme cytochrome c family protein
LKISRVGCFIIPGLAFLILLAASACNFVNQKDAASGSTLGQIEPGASIPSYAAVNQAVFAPYCISCHNSGANIGSLTNYADVYNLRGAVQDRVLVTGSMPQGRALPASLKTMLATWLEAGSPEEGTVGTPAPSPSPTAHPSPGPTPPPTTTLQPTFSSLQSQVFRFSCMGCHSGSGGSGGISFSTLAQLKAGSHSILEMSVPGDPSSSRLVEAITNSSSSVSKMPPGSSSLSANKIAVIKQWIQAGSPP